MRKLLIGGLLVVVLGAAAAAVLAWQGWERVSASYKGFTGGEQFVEIPSGQGTREIGRRLVQAGIVRDELSFRLGVWWSGHGRDLKAGEYRFDRPASVLDVIARLARGDVYTRRLTFPEGLTIAEMAAHYASAGFGTASSFAAAAGNAALVADLDPAAPDLEGYLFPETYTLPRRVPAERLVATMVARFRGVFTDDLRQRAAAQQLTVREVVSLAALVEKETARAEERPLVAAVYRNRMRRGMPMQADPTVVYALRKAGRYDGNIRRADLQIDSPYNTYRYPGLPPGPIAAPGRASLEAAVAPADTPYLYFVSRNDGSHVFAETLAQHNRNVFEHQVLYFRKLRQAAAGDRAGRGGRPSSTGVQ